MTFATDDLTPLLQAAPTAQMRYASGVIASWNSESFENVVEVRGSLLINLPVLSGPDALTYKAGDVVALVGADQQGARGIASYAILGRFVVPGAGKAAEAIEWMTSELGRAIAAAVFADRIRSDNAPIGQIHVTADQEWQDGAFGVGDTPDPGPTVQVEVSERGSAIIILAADVSSHDAVTARMGFTTSGATTRSADFSFQKVELRNDSTDFASVSATQFVHYEDLNPGLHTFHAQYRTIGGPTGATWSTRSMTVISF